MDTGLREEQRTNERNRRREGGEDIDKQKAVEEKEKLNSNPADWYLGSVTATAEWKNAVVVPTQVPEHYECPKGYGFTVDHDENGTQAWSCKALNSDRARLSERRH